jgi:serine/threonine-protein kinase
MDQTAPPKRLHGPGPGRLGESLTGQVVGGKYRIESVLGRGGMAIVFAARHVTLGQAVAIKVLKPEIAGGASQAERVVREARAAARLSSENATRVLDIDALDSGEPYIVMEQLQGADLGQVLARRGPLPVRDAAGYVVQACDAIAEAHAMNLVHRDLKPSNLFLTTRRDGSDLVKLMDFGISKLISTDPEDSITATHESLGTPHYMSPEQLMTAKDVDTRTDIWALGVIVYRLLTGQYPFVGETTPALHVAIASAPAPRLRDVRADAPAEIEALVLACLAKSHQDRPRSVHAVARVLLPFADDDTRRRYAHLAETPGGLLGQGDPVEAGAAEASTRAELRRVAFRGTRRAVAVAGSVVVGLAISLGVGLVWAARRPVTSLAAAMDPPVASASASSAAETVAVPLPPAPVASAVALPTVPSATPPRGGSQTGGAAPRKTPHRLDPYAQRR